MFGGMAKLGRGGGGGGRGGGKRPLPPPPPSAHIQRVGPSAGGRLPIGSSSAAATRGRHGVGRGPGGPAAAAATEETFSMVSADTLDVAAIIRLTPDLVDEIRRLEAQGGAARIKFDPNSNNLSGNVIDVGGKEFKFTWSEELGVCDIYEERQNGESGNGLLSECGSAWRKLNVQRILDESLKNHVKMRSEEAERRLKSRKSIVLDPANPSVKNQAKTMAAAAVEGNMRRMHWKKDQAFKKRKTEPVPNTVASRSVLKSGVPSNSSSGAILPVSPQPSPREQAETGASVSPFGVANPPRGHSAVDEDLARPTSNGEDIIKLDKELSKKPVHGATSKPVGHKKASSCQPQDLRSLLVNLLLDNPKGMSLKALEKTVGEVIPNSGKKIESIIKTIATYQAPGRYILKPGLEVESCKRPPSESGSSPEHPPGSLPVTKAMENDNSECFEHTTQITQINPKPVGSDTIENIDIEHNSPDQSTADRKINNEDEEGACSSSESGSDTDSESDSSDSGSDSGSQSRSRSKSQSPMGSGSASSSDSESDGSSSSKEGSDVDVDIMTSDDEKEERGNKLPMPGEGRAYDEGHEENAIERGNLGSQRASPPINSHDYVKGDDALAVEDTERRSKDIWIKASENYETVTTKSVVSDGFQVNVQDLGEGMASQEQQQQPVPQLMPPAQDSMADRSDHVTGHGPIDKQFIRKDCRDLEQIDGAGKVSKGKSKRTSDSKIIQEKPESSKRPRTVHTDMQVTFGKNNNSNVPEKSRIISPDRTESGQHRGQMTLRASGVDRDQNTFDSQDAQTGKYMLHEDAERLRINPDSQNSNISISDVQRLEQKATDSIGRTFDGAEKSGRHKHSVRSYGRPEESGTSGTRGTSLQGKFFMPKDKPRKDVHDVDMDINEKFSAKSLLDDTGSDKLPSLPDSHHRRFSDQNETQKEAKLSVNMHKADMDKCATSGEKGVPLKRELSDLELGEFREPTSIEDTKEGRRQFERKGSFKSSDSKLNVIDNCNLDSNKGRTAAKAPHELKRESSYTSKSGIQGNQDGSYKKMSESDITESTIPQQRTNSSQNQQFPRTDQPEHDPVSHLDKLTDMAGRSEMRISQGIGVENDIPCHKRTGASVLPQYDTKQNGHMAPKPAMDVKSQKYNGPRDASDHSKESFRVDITKSSGKRMDSSSDEDDLFYAKYDKDEPELRGPIKDFPQYKEYVQEYREKFDCYSSLNSHLEKYRNDFLKVGRDIELSKERDKEAYRCFSEQIMQMYHQCGKKQSRMRKIFIILHDELKVLKQRIKDFAEEYTRD